MKLKRIVSVMLLVVLIISTFYVSDYKISASTSETKYSVKHLQNGSFEENMDSYPFKNGYVQPNRSVVPYWDTTAYGGLFEFFNVNSSAHFKITSSNYPNNPEYRKIADGDIAAELNADEESTIYQRIKTVAGSTYTWGLDHRGRDRTDRMVLIIGPEQPVDPSKPAKTGQDQFVRITNWLKNQYGVEYPEIGCSKKYTVYSKPFAEAGKFVNEVSDEDQNISLYETSEINQEWSVWVISSPYCNNASEHTVNGWSQYGTNASDDFDDIMKGASSSLGYDCTYTVPNGQTKTLFAFSSYSSGQVNKDDITYGNLLDGIEFKLYQPLSTSTSEGGMGSVDADNPELSNITIKSDITSGDALHTTVSDGQYCTIYTKSYNKEGSLTDCTFQGAYVTVNNDDGTSVTRFAEIYIEDMSDLTEEELEQLSKEYFIPETITDPDTGEETQRFYFRVSVETPVAVHLVYAKAPLILYDANGGQDYRFSPDNTLGGNFIGFSYYYQRILDKVVDDEPVYIDTTDYYTNGEIIIDENGVQGVTTGKYISHAALPNENWDTNDDGTSPHKFCGWSVSDADGNLVVLEGNHTVEYNPTYDNGGIVSFADSKNFIYDLLLDATHGITLTALWKFNNRAYAQTYNSVTDEFENSAVGGTIEETLIPGDLRASDITEYKQSVGGEDRVGRVDALGNIGDKIMFKANPDFENDYMFVGWYHREKQADGTYQDVLRSTSTSIAVTVEEGIMNTYYARFQKMTLPVIFHYTQTGSAADYDFYDKSADFKYGKYFQDVSIGNTAVKPSGDSKSVDIWYTSPTDRSPAYIFDFNTPITEKTNLYAGPTFTYNYFNNFVIQEPWCFNTYGTLKFDGKYIDLKNDEDVTDYNVYLLKGSLGEAAPSASSIKSNKKTIKIGLSNNSSRLLYNTVTNTGKTFNRAGAMYDDFYLFNMKTPIWVVFDFTYKGVTYTSTVNDRSLYNDITTYMDESTNGFFTTFPSETQAELRQAQTELLYSIQNMYDAVAPFGITAPTQYADASSVFGLTYDPATDNTYTFTTKTAIRNIEPWGLQYSFTVDGNTVTDFADYGAVVLADKDGSFQEQGVSIENLLDNENSVMYSYSNSNVYSGEDGAIDVYYINNILASDFDKNVYAVFFVQDEEGNIYYSDIVQNTYNGIAASDTSEYKDVSKSITEYSTALANYYALIEQAKSNNQ